MNKEFLTVLEQLEREKGLDREIFIDAVEQALIVAAKKIAKITSPGADVKVTIDRTKGDIKVWVGEKELVSREFGRIAAQTARQVIIQKIREAEKNSVYQDYKDKVGQIVGGVVYRLEKRGVILDLLGKAEAIIPQIFLSPLDRPRMGERMRALVVEVKRDKGPQIILSRKSEGLVKKLFELEVPEIFGGIVEIKTITREAGGRTKMAVFSKDDKVDCVGACVGIRGSRVKNVIEELRGEKIDIIRWHEDIKAFIKAALSPAVVSKIDIDRDIKRARVLVNADQLSLAIGKKGQNVRLASKLVSWEIDVRTKETIEKSLNQMCKLKSVGLQTAKFLVNNGYLEINSLVLAKEQALAKIKGIGKKKAAGIIEEAKKYLKSQQDKAAEKDSKTESGS
ncbi:MAG: transcription termination factor NusA [Candidatus Omnitrophica bacterium]|nr:transcription termination factor NusA [Candidatus Omnitrophota bacterium]